MTMANPTTPATAGTGDRATDWGACCEHRALQLDRLYEERVAGMDDAVRGIQELLLARGMSEAAGIAGDWAVEGPQRHGDATDAPPA
jgi:hypothetical protein